jgi:methylthioribulose-1-phosphate dehydratase
VTTRSRTATPRRPALPAFPVAARRLAEIGRRFYLRGWMSGTSGNLSAVVSRAPLRLAITESSVPKGGLTPKQILQVDGRGVPTRPASGRPSAETLLHCVIARDRGAGAILHTHSVWSTILSDVHASAGGLAISGFEMQKGLEGVRTHEQREFIPILILENDQDMTRLAARVSGMLRERPDAHAFLLRRHGLYTWGATLDEAERHVEIAEFLFEVLGQRDHRHR